MDNKNEEIQPRPPASKQRDRVQTLVEGVKAWAPTRGQLVGVTIALLALSNGWCLIQLSRLKANPEVMTVGVRQLTQQYMAEMALSDLPPEEVAIRTELFLSVMQDTLRRAAEGQNVVLIAREAVLAGAATDVTDEVNTAVKNAMRQAVERRGPTQKVQPTSPAATLPRAGQ